MVTTSAQFLLTCTLPSQAKRVYWSNQMAARAASEGVRRRVTTRARNIDSSQPRKGRPSAAPDLPRLMVPCPATLLPAAGRPLRYPVTTLAHCRAYKTPPRQASHRALPALSPLLPLPQPPANTRRCTTSRATPPRPPRRSSISTTSSSGRPRRGTLQTSFNSSSPSRAASGTGTRSGTASTTVPRPSSPP